MIRKGKIDRDQLTNFNLHQCIQNHNHSGDLAIVHSRIILASSQLPVDKNYQFITVNRTVINPLKP